MISKLLTVRSWSLAVVALLLTLVVLSSSAMESEGNQTTTVLTAQTNIISSSEQGLTFELLTPRAAIDSKGSVTVEGLHTAVDVTGSPRIPYYSTYVAIPPEATFDVTVNLFDSDDLQVPDIAPAPSRQLISQGLVGTGLTNAIADSTIETAPEYVRNPEIYGKNVYYPDQKFALSDEMLFGSLRLVKVDLYPLSYNPVSGTLRQATRLMVTVNFEGAKLNESGNGKQGLDTNAFWRENIINLPPASWQTAQTKQSADEDLMLPVGAKTLKLIVNEDGIHEISGATLGKYFDLSQINPTQIQMMHRGKPIAYEFVDANMNGTFESGDAIRFFGWKFDGSRYEDMYVGENVFWLWPANTGLQIAAAANDAGKGYPVVTTYRKVIEHWPHENFFEGWSVKWAESTNEPTAWHGGGVKAKPGEVGHKGTYFELTDPAAAGEGLIDVEITTRLSLLREDPVKYAVKLVFNGKATSETVTWDNAANLNVTLPFPVSDIHPVAAANLLDLNLIGDAANTNDIYVYQTRATLEYPRNLVAEDNQLLFGHETAGNHEFHVSGFADPGQVIVWDVSERNQPVSIDITAGQLVGSGPEKTLLLGRAHASNSQFIATTEANVIGVLEKNVSEYVPADLTPPGNAGIWVAVAHESLRPAADKLAAYRTARSGISTWVVDISDVVNQYGFGYNTPEAVRNYLRHAYNTWVEAPQFLTLVGDASLNPRGLPCLICGTQEWNDHLDTPSLVHTDFQFVDRFNGLIPVDFTFGLLIGDDLIPELYPGRIPAQTLAEANASVDKIIKYEESFDSEASWHKNIVFVADNPDSGGNFCIESGHTAGFVPNSIDSTFLCLQSEDQFGTLEEYTEDLRLDLFEQINQIGSVIINYRGHGGITGWANPSIMHVNDAGSWQNVNKTPVILSADCLDGHFARPDREGLGETLFGLTNGRGSSAHWSSSGLGFSFEHSILHEAFYDAIFAKNIATIGEAIDYSKLTYLSKGYHESEAYAFALLGDPAMVVYPWTPSINLPIIMRP